MWSQQSTLLMNANMANSRWRCVDLASLAIAFSKRDPPVEMGFQRVCTTIEIIIIHRARGHVANRRRWTRLRTEAGDVALSVGLQPALAAAARRQLSAVAVGPLRASLVLQACKLKSRPPNNRRSPRCPRAHNDVAVK